MRYHEFMSPDETHARLLLKIRDVGTRDTLALVATLEAKMAELFPPGSGITYRLTGDAYVSALGLTQMIHELLFSILTAAFVIFGLIAVLFRSLRIGLITIPPNVIPLVVTFGYMGLRGFDLNAGNVIVFTISLGIAVDNTIHYILRFREEYRPRPRHGPRDLEDADRQRAADVPVDLLDGDRPGRAACFRTFCPRADLPSCRS